MTNEELDHARAEEAWVLYNSGEMRDVSAIAARLAREGWTPPVTVDPDLIEVREIVARLYDVSWPERANSIRVGDQDHNVENVSALAGIKRGRELERAEAKPGMVWKEWGGAPMRPLLKTDYVWAKNKERSFVSLASTIAWSHVTHYAEITQPEEK